MRSRAWLCGVVVTTGFVGLLAGGCAGDDVGTAPDASTTVSQPATGLTEPIRPADLTGTITNVSPFEPVTANCTPPDELDPDGAVSSDDPPICTDPENDIEGTILVEAPSGAPVGGLGDKASLTIRRNQTAIWVCGPGNESVPGSFQDLATGGSVSVWVDGPVAESYPVQATASALATGSCD